MNYAELQVTSNFSFLRGGSHPEELIDYAADLGYRAIALTDRNTLAGIVRAHVKAKERKIQFIPACRLDLQDGPSLLAYPTSIKAYARLSALLTLGKRRAEKGYCNLFVSDVVEYSQGIKLVVVPPEQLEADFNFSMDFLKAFEKYERNWKDQLYLAASVTYLGEDQKRLFQLSRLSQTYNVPLVAVNNVHYHSSERRELQDVLTCIREKCTISTAGFNLYRNAERYLKPKEEIYRLFRDYPEALENTLKLVEKCQFSLDELNYLYPEEITTNGRTPMDELKKLTWEGAMRRWRNQIPEGVKQTLQMELDFIERRDYASYFLTVYDYVREARSRKILCQGRGSAANSAVCYCLGITSVDPSKFKLLFARFMSDERNEPPDIDVDFEHERREEIMQYIYNKYGRDRAGIVATVTQVHWKGAVRDVGKVMGLSADMIQLLSKSAYELKEKDEEQQSSFNRNDPTLKKVIDLTEQYIGFPRQLGQHTGGFVITREKLHALCPVLNARMADRTCIEWNKDDIEALGFMKVDVLSLGMLTCIRKAFDLIKATYSRQLSLASVPQDDPRVYDMISRADTLGVFQIESRAQMTMLPRLKPKCFYDLVIEVAIVRPGPIQGDMVHPYLKRRNGEEPVEYPSKDLERILGRTLGVPLFQEQAMEIAIVAAGFTPAEADGLRRSMATFKAKGLVSRYREKLISGMVKNGYEEAFAHRVFKQLEGFGSYGFPESHAASFALLVYVSAWVKYYYPEVFATALLNSQPMGFYQPSQIVTDARRHRVRVLPVDINYSEWNNSLEKVGKNEWAMRLGFRMIKGIRLSEMNLVLKRRNSFFRLLPELLKTGISFQTFESLADADAFRSLGLDRRQALWKVAALADHPEGLFEGQKISEDLENEIHLPKMTDQEHVIIDYEMTSLSLKAHPLQFLREQFNRRGMIPASRLKQMSNGESVFTGGLVTVRQRPGTAKGVLFITIEDETGFANLVIWSTIFERYRKTILQSHLLIVHGKIQRQGEVIHIVVESCENANELVRLKVKEYVAGSVNKPMKIKKEGIPVQGELFRSRDFK